MAHTPGPWHVERRNCHIAVYPKNRPERVADVYLPLDVEDGASCDDNAHLIAAAPQMLEALEAVEFTSVTGREVEEYFVCPSCNREFDHALGCKLHLAIRAAKGE